jgi:WD40 repeat protein
LESRTIRFEAASQAGWRLQTEFAPVFSGDGRRLAVGCDDGAVSVWDLFSRQLERKLPVDLGWIGGCIFSPDGRYLVVCGAPDWRFSGGYVWIWDLEQPHAPARVIQAEIRTVRRVAFHPDGRQIAVCGGDQRPSIWDFDSGERLLFLKGHSSDVEWIQYSQDGRWLVTASWDGTARVWNAQNGEEVLTYQVPGQNRFDMAFFTPDADCICAVGDDGYYRLLAFQDFDRLVELIRRRVVRDWKPEERARYLHE